ncbi:MAG TPA: hypothetical protein VFT79_11620 [Solirubrobacterales bacterium]|nr:hypothetical protein [Solirubrobacterales bacterium]
MFLYPWQQQNLVVRSDPDRCARINKKSLRMGSGAKSLTPIAALSPSAEVPLRPAAALAQLGKVALPRAGMGVWGHVSRWSWIQHLWAFAEPAPGRSLRLRPEARLSVGRQKGQLSEQLGIALGLSVVEHILKEGRRDIAISIVDADVALALGQLEGHFVQHLPQRLSRPDYFVLRRFRGSPQIEIFALECKGGEPSIATLATAARQLHGVGVVTPNGPVPPPGFLTAATFRKDAIVIDAFDPEGDGVWNGPAAPRFAPREVVGERYGSKGVVDPMGFRRVLLAAEEIALMLIAGRLFVEGEFYLPPNPPLRRETSLGDFEGSRAILSLSPSTDAEVFFGVHTGIITAILTDEDESIDAARARLVDRLFERFDEPGFAEVEEEEAMVVREDGVMLQARLIRHRTY